MARKRSSKVKNARREIIVDGRKVISLNEKDLFRLHRNCHRNRACRTVKKQTTNKRSIGFPGMQPSPGLGSVSALRADTEPDRSVPRPGMLLYSSAVPRPLPPRGRDSQRPVCAWGRPSGGPLPRWRVSQCLVPRLVRGPPPVLVPACRPGPRKVARPVRLAGIRVDRGAIRLRIVRYRLRYGAFR